jgi:effector-binding domain-containing protein
MGRDVVVVQVEPSPIAAVCLRTTLAKWPTQFGKVLGIVYEAVHAGKVQQDGQNVMIYRPAGGDQVDIECGVQVAMRFENLGEVVCCETPGGTAATLAHIGPYSQLRASHRAIFEWGRENGRPLSGVCWEIYGDWNNDPAQLRTDIFHLLEP